MLENIGKFVVELAHDNLIMLGVTTMLRIVSITAGAVAAIHRLSCALAGI